MHVDIFDPEGGQKWPNIKAVEYCLCIGRAEWPDGTSQFRDDLLPGMTFSPRLPLADLEEFCRVNLPVYEKYFEENERAVEALEHPTFPVFW